MGKRIWLLKHMLAGLAMVGLCIPQAALAAVHSDSGQSVVADIQLHEGGILFGKVVNPQNMSVAGTEVSLYAADRVLAKAKTDRQGQFAFAGLRQGVYHLAAADGGGVLRAWPQKVAPPASQPQALIVSGEKTVRGQMGGGRLLRFMSNPWVLAAMVAAAIAVPVAIHNNKHPAS